MGGTLVNSPAATPANFPFVDPATQQPIGQFPVTRGNRSGSLAISANALDALLFPGASGVAPGIFGLVVCSRTTISGRHSCAQSEKGVDLLSAPKVTTKSGQRAIIEVVREFQLSEYIYSPAGSLDQQHYWKHRYWRCDNRSCCCDSNDASKLGDAKHRSDFGGGTSSGRGCDNDRPKSGPAGCRV